MRRPFHPSLVVFDMIGTTVAGADAVGAVFRDTVEASGLAVPPSEIARVRGLNKKDAFRTLAALRHHEASAADRLGSALHDLFRARLQRQMDETPPAAIPGTDVTFRWLAGRAVPIALASGLDRDFVDAIVGRLGWSTLIAATACADDVSRGRPAPDLIHEAIRRTNVATASSVLVVGDTVTDLEAARAAGVGAAIGVLSGAGSEDALRAAPHDAILTSVADLPAWLESYQAGTTSA